MMIQFKEIIEESFSELTDHRRAEGQRHPLINLIVISVCAVIANAESESDIAEYALAKQEQLSNFLDMKYGVPSEPTFRRFLSLVDSDQLEKCFIEFTKRLSITVKSKHIAIDGKTLCSSYDHAKGQPAIHMLSALATEYGLTLAQIKTDDKSNEITVIPKLIEMLNIEDTVISMDAMGTQKSIAKQIVESKGDYVLALKSNHKTFYDEVEDFFQQLIKSEFKCVKAEQRKIVEKGHGRIEEREYFICGTKYDCFSETDKWEGIQSVICTTTKRQEVLSGSTSTDIRFFISSLSIDYVDKIITSIRSHWGIENSLHYVLDVTFNEDYSRIRTKYAAENFSVLRRLALNVIRCDKSKGSVRTKRLRAALNDTFMADLLLNSSNQRMT